MASGAPLTDDSGLPVDVGVLPSKPGELQDQWQARLFQNVNSDHGDAGQEHDDRFGLVRDGAQAMAIQGPDWHGLRQRLDAEFQLTCYLPTDDTGVDSGVNECG